MRTVHTSVSEKNAEFKTKYGQSDNKSINQSTSLLNKANHSKPGLLVDEKITISKEPIKGIFDSGPVLKSSTVSKSLERQKLPYGKGENKKIDECGEQIWKHKNIRAYDEKTRRIIRQEFNVPASAVVQKLNEPFKFDKKNNENEAKCAQKKYIYGMNLSGGVLDEGSKNKTKNVIVPHLNNTTTTKINSPFKGIDKFDNSRFMVDKAIQCDLKRSKTPISEKSQYSKTGWKHYVEEPQEPKFREFSSDKWYYDQDEYEAGEIIPTSSRQISGIGDHYKVSKWTKDINPSSIEHKTELEKKVDTEYKHNLIGSFKVIRPDKNGTVTTYSNVKPLSSKSLGLNSAGQQVISCNKTGEVIYSQVDKSRKRILRDQIHSPLPGYAQEDSGESENELKSKNVEMSNRLPSPVSRTRMICLNIPSEKQKAKFDQERLSSPENINNYIFRSSSTGPRVISNRTYQIGYGYKNDNPIEPPPQFATLGHKLPPKAPTPVKSMLARSSSATNPYSDRRIPIEIDSKWYYQTEQSNLSDQSSVFGVKKNCETLEETMSFISSGSEFVDKEPLFKNQITGSTLKESNKKKREISYNNHEVKMNSKNKTFQANPIMNKSTDEDFQKDMEANKICIPSFQDSSTLSRLGKKSSSTIVKTNNHLVHNLDDEYLNERKKRTSSSLLNNKISKNITKRPSQQVRDFEDSSRMIRGTSNKRQFGSSHNLAEQQSIENQSKQSDKQIKQRSSSLTRYNESESDVSITSTKIKSDSRALSGLNYPIRPVTRSASMHHPPNSSSLFRKNSSAIRSTESDHGYGIRSISRQSQTSTGYRLNAGGKTLIQNDPVVLYLPAIDNSVKQMNILNTKNAKSKSSGNSKTLSNKKFASSTNLSTINTTNSIFSKIKSNANINGSKNDLSKSSDKLSEITMNGYQNSKTLAKKTNIKSSKELKRSQSIPSSAKLPFLQKLRNKLKSKEQ